MLSLRQLLFKYVVTITLLGTVLIAGLITLHDQAMKHRLDVRLAGMVAMDAYVLFCAVYLLYLIYFRLDDGS